MRVLIILFFFSVLVSGCNSAKTNQNILSAIEFGSGGGITGRVVSHRLVPEEDKIYLHDGSVEQVQEQKVQEIREFIRENKLSRIDFSHPYNRYFFIVFHTGEGNNKVVWGNPDQPAPAEVKELYEMLMNLSEELVKE